ncbi:MAG TPA: DUF6658 family protein [Candidatus Caenarcaniphilales bacterium]
MNKLFSFCKKIRLGQILTIFLAGVVLLVTTACNNGGVQGARPDNPPLQAGGNNNPYKGGGDGYTNLRMSTDPKLKAEGQIPQHNQAGLPSSFNHLIASSGAGSNEAKLLYPGSEITTTGTSTILDNQKEQSLQNQAIQNAEQPQPVLIQRNPEANVLEKSAEAFKEASSFLKTKSDEAGTRPEAQSNPARH